MAIFDFLNPLRLLFRRVKRNFPVHFMQVVVENADGTTRTVGWHRIKPPDHYPADGPTHIGPYIEKLVAFQGHHASLSFFSPDEQRGFSLTHMQGQITADFLINWREEPDKEKAVRDFFSARGIQTAEEYLFGDADGADNTRALEWPLPTDADSVTTLSRQILRELCRIEDHEALTIAYQET